MKVRLVVVFILTVALGGCIVHMRQLDVRAGIPPGPAVVETPVKAHLRDGSVVVFLSGVTVTTTTVEGAGARYDMLLRSQGTTSRVPLDSVVAFESFRDGVNMPASVALSLAATGATVVGSALLAVAIFGSCPTIYADSAGAAVLQAESFSYSIAPLFETRDVDAVYGRADSTGVVWLELRNEALETHYINHLELLEVRHAAAERVLPDELGRPVVIGTTIAPRDAVDASGRDVRAALVSADSSWYATAEARIAAAQKHDFSDHVDMRFALPEARDSVGLVLQLRNSLLNTILFYDVMLGDAGAGALDWLGGTLEEIGSASEMAQWYRRRSGVVISVWHDGAYEPVARVGDVGPIAWKSVAVMVPVHGVRDLRIRLQFLADSWRIDRVALAPDARRGAERVLPVSHVVSARRSHDDELVTRLREPDEQYLITYPGTSVRVGFAAGGASADAHASYLLAAQGYYTEWVRTDWIRATTQPAPFAPGDAALERLYTRWRERRGDFEAQFFGRRVPVEGS